MFNFPPLGPSSTERPQKRRILVGAQEYRMYIPCEFGVDRPTRFRDMDYAIFPHWPQGKNVKIQPLYPPPQGPRGPITPKLPRSRPWCLLYPEPKFHADRTILRWDILNRTNKQTKTKKSKLNITQNATLYGEIKTLSGARPFCDS